MKIPRAERSGRTLPCGETMLFRFVVEATVTGKENS
jgi:hypothetical protein